MKNKLKKYKLFSLISAIINLVVVSILLYGLVTVIENIRTLSQVNGGSVPSDSYSIYKSYSILFYVLSIDGVFSLLIISSSVRIDQIFYRLKWVNSLVSTLTIVVSIALYILNVKYPTGGGIKISVLLYIIIAINTILMHIDVISIYLKYKNNPFYHNGKFKRAYTTYQVKEEKKEEKPVVDNNDPLKNLSYFELYEKRSEELHQVENDFDQGLINEQEYNRRRKEIYAKYDKYN